MNNQVRKAKLNDEAQEIRQLKAIYNKAGQDILDKIRIQDEKINILMKDLDNLTEEQRSILQSAIYQKKYQQSILNQLDAYTKDLQSTAHTSIEDYMKKCYETSYIGNLYDLHKQGIPLAIPIDQKKVLRALELDSKLSRGLLHRIGVDINLLKRKVANNVARGISAGQSYSEIARNLMATTTESFNSAMRIARTEGGRVASISQMDAMKDAKDSGADIVKQWDSALDGRVRDTHRKLDGQIRELDEPFEVFDDKLGVITAEMPHGFGIASQDINCRCAMNQRAKWMLDEEELEILKERAEALGIDKADQFEEFRKKYMKGTEFPEVKVNEFVPAKTIAEAEEFAKQFVDLDTYGSVGLSYRGVGLDVANEINRALHRVFSVFDIDKLGGISAPAKNTKLGKKVTAKAGYSPIRKSLLLNRDNTKNIKKFMEGFDEDARALKELIEHPERFDFDKLSKEVKQVVELAKQGVRTIVPETVEESIIHELGHHIEKKVRNQIDVAESMAKYGRKVSGYATTQEGEYIAESFASYMRGENIIDPALKKVFDGMRKVKVAEEVAPKVINGRTLVRRGAVKSARKPYAKSVDIWERLDSKARIGGLSEYPQSHQKAILEKLDNAPVKLRVAWNKFCNEFHVGVKRRGQKGAWYSPREDKVFLSPKTAYAGTDLHAPLETYFHEFGHHLDYSSDRLIYGASDGKISRTGIMKRYKDGLFSKTINKEIDEALERFGKERGLVKTVTRKEAYVKAQNSLIGASLNPMKS